MTTTKVSTKQLNNGFIFKARRTTDQSIGDSTATVIVFQTEDIDTNNNYDTSTGHYTVPVAGYYQINANFDVSGPSGGTGASNSMWGNAIYVQKNGATIDQVYGVVGYDQMKFQQSNCAISQVYLFAAGDVIRILAMGDPNGGGAAVVLGATTGANFSGFLIQQTA